MGIATWYSYRKQYVLTPCNQDTVDLRGGGWPVTVGVVE